MRTAIWEVCFIIPRVPAFVKTKRGFFVLFHTFTTHGAAMPSVLQCKIAAAPIKSASPAGHAGPSIIFVTHGSRLRRAGLRNSRFHDTRVGFPVASPPWPPPSTRAKFSSLLLHPLHFCVRSCIIIEDAGCPHTAKVRKKPFVAGKRTFVCRLRRTDIFPTLGRKSPKTQGGFLPFSGISEEII